MNKKTVKEYVYTNLSMLLAAKIIAYNLKDNISELSKLNPKWNEVYTNNLIARIEDALNNYLGYDVKRELREATSILNSIMLEIKTDISVFKLLINKLYKREPYTKDEIINVLGLKHYPKTNASR